MCNVCCKEFRGWCRAFTATEVILSIVQAVLLTLFVAFVTFIVLHFVACSEDEAERLNSSDWPVTCEQTNTPSGTKESGEDTSYSPVGENGTIWSTVLPHVACTWTPSAKTKVVTQYFEHAEESFNASNPTARPRTTPPLHTEVPPSVAYHGDTFVTDQHDGEPARNEKTFIMALVKMRPPDGVTFGCTLTIVSEFWTLTAASCLESIEEVDSLDSFVMMKNFGEPRHGGTHSVSDVLIHPQYQGSDDTYDIGALKSHDKLTSTELLLKLPTALDYLLITIGEELTILGFGKFRSIDRDAFERGARAVSVHVLPSAQCAARGAPWSARHLAGGAPLARVACGTAAVCAGPLYARGMPCNYCAGTPLVQARVLLGLMSGPGPCGAPCEPALYVNLAASQDWLSSVLGDN